MAKKIEGKENTGRKDIKQLKGFEDSSGMLLRIKVLFERSSACEVHFTSDGTAFYQAEHAAIHSENLADNKIVTIKREEIE